MNTVLASALPLLGGKPQPLMISTIFDKTLLENDTCAQKQKQRMCQTLKDPETKLQILALITCISYIYIFC